MSELRKAVIVPKAKVAQEAKTILSIVTLCDRFHTMPKAGGLFEQDSLFVYMLDSIMAWEYERQELDRANASRKK